MRRRKFDPEPFVRAALERGWPPKVACGAAALFEFASEQLAEVRDTSMKREESEQAARLLASVATDVTTALREVVQELCREVPAQQRQEIVASYEAAVGAEKRGKLRLVEPN